MTTLAAEQKRRLHADGYIVIPRAVPDAFVRRALRAINHDLGKGIDPARLAAFRSGSFCPTLCRQPPILDLFARTGVREASEAIVGALKPVEEGQCALRWPEPVDGPISTRPLWPHIDGLPGPASGVPDGALGVFTCLACVFLSDLPTSDAGNFTVWPGSHRVLARVYREQGLAAILRNATYPTMPGYGDPVQITGCVGDLLIAHHLVGHDYSLNLSPHVRYAVFFRLASAALTDANKYGTLERPWRDWTAMRDIEDG